MGCCVLVILACSIDALARAEERKWPGPTDIFCGVGMRDGGVGVARRGCEDDISGRVPN
jgi:hypothetical protein